MNDTPDELKTALEQIEDNTPWTVDDWDLSMGSTTSPTVDLTLEYDGEPVTGLKAAVKKRIAADTNAEGAPIERVVSDVANEHDESIADVKTALEHLKQMGEVYEPNLGHLRVA